MNKKILFAAVITFNILQFHTANAATEADTNKDNMISKVEFLKASSKRFAAADLDNNGILSREEFPLLRKNSIGHAQSKFINRTDINDHNPINTTAPPKEPHNKSYTFNQQSKSRHRPSRLDKNRDGQISSKEYQRAIEQMFHKLDANNDGVLTRGERRKKRGRTKP